MSETEILSYEYDDSLIKEFVYKQFPHESSSIREAVSNAIDSIVDRLETEQFDGRVNLIIKPDFISCEDNGTGDLRDEILRRVGTQSKSNKNRIGNKGVGRFSLLRFTEKIDLHYSYDGYIIYSRQISLGGVSKAKPIANSPLIHKGSVWFVANTHHVIDLETLREKLVRWFSLKLIQNNIKLYLNNELIKPQSPQPQNLSLVASNGLIVGGLYQDRDSRGRIDVYCRGVFIQQYTIDDKRAFGGWVNYDALDLVTTRDQISHDAIGVDFIKRLRQYCRRFPQLTDQTKEYEEDLIRETMHDIGSLLKNANIKLEGEIIKQKSRSPKDKNVNRVRIKSEPQHPLSNTLRKYGIQTVYDNDDDLPFLWFEPPNIIHYNKGSRLFRRATLLRTPHLLNSSKSLVFAQIEKYMQTKITDIDIEVITESEKTQAYLYH